MQVNSVGAAAGFFRIKAETPEMAPEAPELLLSHPVEPGGEPVQASVEAELIAALVAAARTPDPPPKTKPNAEDPGAETNQEKPDLKEPGGAPKANPEAAKPSKGLQVAAEVQLALGANAGAAAESKLSANASSAGRIPSRTHPGSPSLTWRGPATSAPPPASHKGKPKRSNATPQLTWKPDSSRTPIMKIPAKSFRPTGDAQDSAVVELLKTVLGKVMPSANEAEPSPTSKPKMSYTPPQRTYGGQASATAVTEFKKAAPPNEADAGAVSRPRMSYTPPQRAYGGSGVSTDPAVPQLWWPGTEVKAEEKSETSIVADVRIKIGALRDVVVKLLHSGVPFAQVAAVVRASAEAVSPKSIEALVEKILEGLKALATGEVGTDAHARAEPAVLLARDGANPGLANRATLAFDAAASAKSELRAPESDPVESKPALTFTPEHTPKATLKPSEAPADKAAAMKGVVLSQIADQLKELMEAKQPRTLTIRLDPPELGSLSLSVRTVGQRVEAQILTSNPEVRGLIDVNRQQLVHALESRGLELGAMFVGHRPGSRDGNFAAAAGAPVWRPEAAATAAAVAAQSPWMRLGLGAALDFMV